MSKKLPQHQPHPADGSGDLLPLLVRGGFITQSVRRLVERFTARWDVTPFHALLLTEVMAEQDLADALAKLLGVDRIFNVRTATVDEEALKIIGFQRARQWECLVLKTEHGTRDLVIADPSRNDRTQQLKQELKLEMTLAVAERSDIVGAIDELFPLSAQLPSLFADDLGESSS